MRAQLVVQTLVPALPDQVHVQLAQRGGKPVRVFEVERPVRFDDAQAVKPTAEREPPDEDVAGILPRHPCQQLAVLVDQADLARTRLEAPHHLGFSGLVGAKK